MRWKSLLTVAVVAGLVGLLPSPARAQNYRGGIYVPGGTGTLSIYYPANSYYYPGISNEPFATNYYTRRWYNYPPTTSYFSWGYSGSAYAPGMRGYAYAPAYTGYVNPGLGSYYAPVNNGYSMPVTGYTGYYVPNYGGVVIGAGGNSIYIPNYP
jgi:hypothetical protein